MFNLFRNRSLIAWILFSVVAAIVFALYLTATLDAASSNIIMPLDDVYIHFQYGKQIALGQPYVYNPGQPPTSGATSFLYPYILALGYGLGFQELNLGLWAMLGGTFALIFSMIAIYHLCLALDIPYVFALIGSLMFAITGLTSWHYMSGMETGFVTAFALWTLYYFVKKHAVGFITSASLLALIRPEGSIMAVLASGLFLLRILWDKYQHRAEKLTLSQFVIVIPVSMLFLQPLVNYLVTGSAVASGNSAKSLLGIVPRDYALIFTRITENFFRIWWEFFTGYSSEQGIFLLPLLLSLMALVGLISLLINRKTRWNGLLIIAWLLVVSVAISTLDTAFWHFRRYQIPLMSVFFPLAIVGLLYLQNRLLNTRAKYVTRVIIGVWFVSAILIFVNFLALHRLNVRYVYQQPYQMALWLDENTPSDSVVAVHDVGMMRYIGGRTTLDIVGLTTPGAAKYWRSGPGAIGEFLLDHQPDYIASYGRGHGYGLYMLVDTSLYGEPLAEFPIEDWDRQVNVALAADFQGIYQPDWTAIEQSRLIFKSPYLNSFKIVDSVNVGNLDDEEIHEYAWRSDIDAGFVTEFRQLPHLPDENIVVMDGVRRITGEEAFVMHSDAVDSAHLLITRLHPTHAGIIDIYINDEYLDRQWIPEMPGYWLDITTPIPAKFSGQPIKVRIVPTISNGDYQPGYHILVPYVELDDSVDEQLATYQDGHIVLTAFDIQQENDALNIGFDWQADGDAEGDYRFFVHLYGDMNQPPVAQYDAYPYRNTQPIGNWIRGGLHDRIVLDLSGVASDTYQLAIGFYDPSTQGRLLPASDSYQTTDDGRLFLGTVEIMGDG